MNPAAGGAATGGAATGAAATGGTATAGGPAGNGGDLGASGAPIAGAAGGAGEGGTSGMACQHATDGEIRAWLFHELPSPASSELHPFLAMTTTGPDIPLRQLSMRYFFSGEGSGDWQTQCLWVTQDGGSGNGLCDHGVAIAMVELNPPLPTADRYLEVSFPRVGNEVLSNLVPPVVEARTRIWRDGHPTLNQSNDYSFVPTQSTVLNVEGKAFKQTTRVAVYRNGTLVWGEEPCP